MAGRRNREKDNRAWAYRRSGASPEQIARVMKYSSILEAKRAIERGAADNAGEYGDEARQIEAARLDDLTLTLMKIRTKKHYVIAPNGAIARDPETREPLEDDGPVIQAITALIRISDRRSKLLGLDAPSKREITIDQIDQQIATLEQILAQQTGSRPQHLN
jgi:hypothetical protein